MNIAISYATNRQYTNLRTNHNQFHNSINEQLCYNLGVVEHFWCFWSVPCHCPRIRNWLYQETPISHITIFASIWFLNTEKSKYLSSAVINLTTTVRYLTEATLAQQHLCEVTKIKSSILITLLDRGPVTKLRSPPPHPYYLWKQIIIVCNIRWVSLTNPSNSDE